MTARDALMPIMPKLITSVHLSVWDCSHEAIPISAEEPCLTYEVTLTDSQEDVTGVAPLQLSTPVPFLKSHGDTRLEGEGNTRNEQTHSHCVRGKRTLEGKDWDLGKRNVFY